MPGTYRETLDRQENHETSNRFLCRVTCAAVTFGNACHVMEVLYHQEFSIACTHVPMYSYIIPSFTTHHISLGALCGNGQVAGKRLLDIHQSARTCENQHSPPTKALVKISPVCRSTPITKHTFTFCIFAVVRSRDFQVSVHKTVDTFAKVYSQQAYLHPVACELALLRISCSLERVARFGGYMRDVSCGVRCDDLHCFRSVPSGRLASGWSVLGSTGDGDTSSVHAV